MKRRPTFGRTKLALLLVLVAVAVPSISWLWLGTEQLEREATLTKNNLHAQASKKAFAYADKLGDLLERLRETEERRPFYHYQNLYFDPKAAVEGAGVLPSPLAQGLSDPLVLIYFQVDEKDSLQVPTINDEFPELDSQEISTHCALYGELSEVTAYCSMMTTTDIWPPVNGAGWKEWNVVKLTESGWYQHLEANKVYAALKYGSRTPVVPRNARSERRVKVYVGPFSWHTLPVGDVQTLVALRSVRTPVGMWRQGFVVSPETVAPYLAEAPYPARFQPTVFNQAANGHPMIVAPVGVTDWTVAFDLDDALAVAARDAADERGRFLSAVTFSTVFALLAGMLVVGLVYQSERLAQQRAQFAASAAHELRTPIAGLRLYGEMLAEGLGDPTRARAYARRLAGEAERLGRVVTNVLSFTHLERQTLSVHARPGDLVEAVHDAVERQRPALEEAGAVLEVDLPTDAPEVSFDRDAVNHVVQNLLDNAEKYTREIDDRRVRVSLDVADDALRLSVADNGHGVPQAVQGRLFKPFGRGEHGDAVSGLGLGLVLVRALTEAQGGTIRYSDAPDGGAVFTVLFPRSS